MIPRYLLDSNVIIRFLAQDHPEHFSRSKSLIALAEEGKCKLILVPWIAAEVVYTLSSEMYGGGREKVAGLLTRFIHGVGIVTIGKNMLLDALKRFAAKNVDFADAMIAAQAKEMEIRPASFDRDLDKFTDIKRLAP